MIKNKKLILIGGGGHCKACIDVIELENKYKIMGILDSPKNINKDGCDIFSMDHRKAIITRI